MKSGVVAAKTCKKPKKNADGLAAKRDTLRADCEELATLRFSADKWKDYNARLTRLANISDLAESCGAALALLEGEGGGSEKNGTSQPPAGDGRAPR